MLLVRWLLGVLQFDPALVDTVLSEISTGAWACMVKWLLEYPHNNMYHHALTALLKVVVLENHEPTLKYLLSSSGCSLLTHLIGLLEKSPRDSSANGVVLPVLNSLRLRAMTLAPTAYLPTYLRDHARWSPALPLIASLTHKQVLQLASKPKAQPSYMGMFRGVSLPGDEDVDDIVDTSLELGSAFASELGFGALEAHDEATDFTLLRHYTEDGGSEGRDDADKAGKGNDDGKGGGGEGNNNVFISASTDAAAASSTPAVAAPSTPESIDFDQMD
jgi:hypothetical protein